MIVLLLAFAAACFVRNPVRAIQRVTLALLALFFTFFGPFAAAPARWPLLAWAQEINALQDFKDVWLSMIGMAVFSLSNIVDNLVRGYSRLSRLSQFLVPLFLLAYFLGIVVAMVNYSAFGGRVLPGAELARYWQIVEDVVVGAVAVECMIAMEVPG